MLRNPARLGAALAVALCCNAPVLAEEMTAGAAQAAVASSFGHCRPAPQYEGRVSHSFYHTLRDGTRIAIRVDRPANGGVAVEGRSPMIWHHSLSISQTTADGAGDEVAAYRRMQQLTRHGYVVVQVAHRGNGQSFGAMRGYQDRKEAQDSFEIT